MDGSGFVDLFNAWLWAGIALLILAPFGIWKIVEIVVWLFQHVEISVN